MFTNLLLGSAIPTGMVTVSTPNKPVMIPIQGQFIDIQRSPHVNIKTDMKAMQTMEALKQSLYTNPSFEESMRIYNTSRQQVIEVPAQNELLKQKADSAVEEYFRGELEKDKDYKTIMLNIEALGPNPEDNPDFKNLDAKLQKKIKEDRRLAMHKLATKEGLRGLEDKIVNAISAMPQPIVNIQQQPTNPLPPAPGSAIQPGSAVRLVDQQDSEDDTPRSRRAYRQMIESQTLALPANREVEEFQTVGAPISPRVASQLDQALGAFTPVSQYFSPSGSEAPLTPAGTPAPATPSGGIISIPAKSSDVKKLPQPTPSETKPGDTLYYFGGKNKKDILVGKVIATDGVRIKLAELKPSGGKMVEVGKS